MLRLRADTAVCLILQSEHYNRLISPKKENSHVIRTSLQLCVFVSASADKLRRRRGDWLGGNARWWAGARGDGGGEFVLMLLSLRVLKNGLAQNFTEN